MTIAERSDRRAVFSSPGLAGGWALQIAVGFHADASRSQGVSDDTQSRRPNGLSETDRASFYHLSEGGELYPLDWLLALDVEVPPTTAASSRPAISGRTSSDSDCSRIREMRGQSVRIAGGRVACPVEDRAARR